MPKAAFDLCVAILFLLLTLFITRPWIFHTRTHLPGAYDPNHEMISPDIMLPLSFAAWIRLSLFDLHQWPLAKSKYLMYPMGSSHARSHDGLMISSLTALLGSVMPLSTAYGFCILLGFFLTGYLCYRFAARRWGRGGLALAIGTSALFLPYLLQRASVQPNLMYVWSIPLTMHLYFKFYDKPTLKRGAAWAFTFPLLALCSWYVLVMGLIFQACTVPEYLIMAARRPRGRRKQTFILGGVAWCLGLLLLLIPAYPMLRDYEEREPITIDHMAEFSTPLVQYLLPYPHPFYDHSRPARLIALQEKVGAAWEAYAGGPIVFILLALLYFCWPRRLPYRLTLCLTLAASLLVTLGPYLQVTRALPPGEGLKLPLYYLCERFSLFRVIRSPGRIHPMFVLTCILASGFILSHCSRFRIGWSRSQKLAWSVFLPAITAVNICWSSTLAPFPLTPRPQVSSYYEVIKNQDSDGGVLDLPLGFYWFPHYSYYQYYHKRPIILSAHYHDAPRRWDVSFIWTRRHLRFFVNQKEEVFDEEVVEFIMSDEFMLDMRLRHVDMIVIHRRFVDFLLEIDEIAADFPKRLRRIEQAWQPRLLHQDEFIRVYTTRAMEEESTESE